MTLPGPGSTCGGWAWSAPAAPDRTRSGTDAGGSDPCTEIVEVEVSEVDGRVRVRIRTAEGDPPLESAWEDKFSIAFDALVRLRNGQTKRFLWEFHDGAMVDGAEVDEQGRPVPGAEAAGVTIEGDEVIFDLPEGLEVDAVEVGSFSRPTVEPGTTPPPGPQYADFAGPVDL